MRRFLRSPHLCSSTGVYLYYSTHIYQQKENEREHTNTHARMNVPSRRASFDTTTTTTRRRRRSYRPLSLADKRKQDTSQSEVPVRPPNASKYSPDWHGIVVKVMPSLPVKMDDLTRRDQVSFGGEEESSAVALLSENLASSEQSSESVSSNAD